MDSRPLGTTGLSVPPIVVGSNVFGWTVDEAQSFRLLDAFVDHGLTAIDSADVYSAWVPGNQGGESETIIGKWLAANPAKRDTVTIFTKVGSDMRRPGAKGLSARWIAEAVEDSLRRLQTDRIDLYFSHRPDPETPHAETLGAYARLLEAGKIRAIGASNYDAALLAEALQVSRDEGLPRYAAFQPEYNLYDRATFENGLAALCQQENIGVVSYWALASGFLSGKYRSEADTAGQRRGMRVKPYLNPRGFAILNALDAVAETHKATPAEVTLAWTMAQPGITAPIASATSVEQIESLARACHLRLTAAEIAALNEASD